MVKFMKKKDSFKKILIVNPFGVGDLLFSTPLIKNLKYYYPDSKITALVAERNIPILENNPHIHRVIGFNRGDYKKLKKKSKAKAYRKLFRVLRKIASRRFDLYIDLSLEHRYSLLPALLGVKPRIGYNYKKRGRFLTEKLDIGGFIGRHVVEYHLSLLRFLGIEPRFRNLELFIKDEEKDSAKKFLKEQGRDKEKTLVAIAPGGGKAWGDKAWYKYWPVDKFSQLAKKIKDKNLEIILLGDSSDVTICDNVSKELGNKVINACGKTNLRQFFALLAEADLVVCNDSGTLHAATALDKKIVALFGPTSQQAYGPYPPSEKKVVVSKDFSCRPCYNKFGVSDCRYNHRCLEQITVEEVFNTVKDLLS